MNFKILKYVAMGIGALVIIWVIAGKIDQVSYEFTLEYIFTPTGNEKNYTELIINYLILSDAISLYTDHIQYGRTLLKIVIENDTITIDESLIISRLNSLGIINIEISIIPSEPVQFELTSTHVFWMSVFGSGALAEFIIFIIEKFFK